MFIEELFIIATNWKQPKFPILREEQYSNGVNMTELFTALRMTHLWTIVTPAVFI